MGIHGSLQLVEQGGKSFVRTIHRRGSFFPSVLGAEGDGWGDLAGHTSSVREREWVVKRKEGRSGTDRAIV